eukprot:TRINITY_DN6161_c0_g1_i1.p1 TRINITY_DN6161_c0_g1~~TRINITY_DN6161_c0_g1_i1.p1  ORF type:complete len:498 (+),score=97.32 TRINITY_DN6161_c0_g1_i1:155-1648(+)
MKTVTINANSKSISVHTQLFINNEWHDSIDGKTLPVINPSTEEVITTVSIGNEKDVDRAVSAARSAFNREWENFSPALRGKLLWKLADLIEENKFELATLETLNVGKPFFESFGFDMTQAINSFRYFAGWADKIQGKVVPLSTTPHALCYIKKEPLGVVGLILPWNFPLQLLTWKLAPCLAAGNCVIIKPSELTPLSTLYLCDLIARAGFPPGVVNVVNGTGPDVGTPLCRHLDIDKIGFTGSTKVGKMVQIAATESNLKHVSLELGGKSPIIVFDDAPDLDTVIAHCFHALFWNAGQCCSAGSRIYVQAGIYPEFVKKMVAMVSQRVVGNPFLKETNQGPQVSQTQMNAVLRYIQSGIEQGAKLEYGGKRVGDKGYFVQPTIFSEVQDSMVICKEEIFGPVMCILKFATPEEVVERANNSIYGLVGAVFTKDVGRAVILSHKVKCGIVWINTYNLIEPGCAWGGFRQSGIGRDLSELALDSYTQPKTVIIDPNNKL